ncbi:MAG TPA: glycoside hydrolase family 2 protein [Acidobacteriaceae bacterium]|nr:glycoside hydrolase family 2 protein [Acidobacteriaceae bacterium]
MLDRSGLALGATGTGPVTLNLGSDHWTLREAGTSRDYPALIPGSTYTNLLAAGSIPDPFFGENNSEVQWVAEKSWFFERSFEAAADFHGKEYVELVCHGLDTLATVELNGHPLGDCNNMFRTWTFDIKPHLRRGANQIRITFNPLTAYVEKQRTAYRKKYGIDLANERSWVRKGPYMWGWDWCRPVLTQGIWKKIEVRGYDVRIADVSVLQNHAAGGAVRLEIHTSVAGRKDDVHVEAEVLLAGSVVATTRGAAPHGEAVLEAAVPEPQLWWPNGVGDQPLYTVRVQLLDADGKAVDNAVRRVGLRTIEVVPPSGDVALHLRVNSLPVFAKGADWIPADNMPTRVTPEILRWYMSQAAGCNFNFLRLWGGGYYEEDELFDLCDELGLMLQFEFKFANASYPVKDEEWMDNLREEIEQQTLRCRNHPSIVIWSGNNEIEYFEGYKQLFHDFIGGIVNRLVPGAFYEVGSGAHGSGDIHSWGVWHGNQPVESYLAVEGFVTEFGMQSTPVPMTVRAFTDPAGRQAIDSPVMQYHELDGSGHGIEIIMHYTEANFGQAAKDFDDALWLTDVNQAWMMRYAVEHWRRDMPRSMAAAIWQYNDCWPGSTWSMVDCFRRPKAILYQSRRFFAPVLVSGLPDPQSGKTDIYVTSDAPKDATGELLWSVTSAAGELLRQGTKEIRVPPRTSWRAEELDLSDLVQSHGAGNLLVWPEVVVDGQTVAQNTLLFGRPKGLKLQQPHLTMTTSGGETRYRVLIETDVSALWVWANLQDTSASFSDNFFDLRRERATEIDVVLDKPMSPFEFRSKLQIRSVYDIAPEMRG